MVAPNGARLGKGDHPALPITPGEVAATAAACLAAGATALHLHARDAAGAHTLDPTIYARFIGAVRDAVGDRLFLQVTTEAVGRYTAAEQMAALRGLELRPDGVSLALRELLPEDAADHGAVRDFLAWLIETGIEPQLILYAPEEVDRLAALRAAGIVPDSLRQVLFVLGRYRAPGEVVEPRALLGFLERHPPGHPWMICAFGREETACLATAAALGGDLRVGFENSTRHGDGALAADNAERVGTIVDIVDRLGRVRERST
jgi:uncharacterized protein (DUF849 family)